MKTTPLFLLVVLLCGCQSDPNASDYTTTKPAVSELVGTYLPTQETVAFLKTKGNYPADMSINLAANRMCRLHNLPHGWAAITGKRTNTAESGSGFWSLHKEPEDGFWEVTLGDAHEGTSLSLFREKPPYTLHIILGDPDSGEALDFEQQGIAKDP